MKKVLLVTVGNTADPILKAIDESHAEDGEVEVSLLYGRPFPGQSASPFEVAQEAKKRCQEMGVGVQTFEAPDPEDINSCLAVAREVLHKVATAEQVIVNFTGGTKALSAAIVHAALTEPLNGELILDYTGGQVRDPQGRVLREAMRVVRSERTATDEILQQVLNRLQQGNYREARLLAERLPEFGRGRFAKQVTEALYLWDEFDYAGAVQVLRRLREAAKMLADDESLASLAELVIRLLEPGQHICDLVDRLHRAQQKQGMPGKEAEHFPLLVADALENSRRRMKENRPTDSVLRSYRAVEVAVQARLFDKGINPWHPNWQAVSSEAMQRYLALVKATEPPRKISLDNGLKLLEAIGQQTLREDMDEKLRYLQQPRNDSYLEHGYQRLAAEDAQRLHGYAVMLCAELSGAPLEVVRESVSHEWRSL